MKYTLENSDETELRISIKRNLLLFFLYSFLDGRAYVLSLGIFVVEDSDSAFLLFTGSLRRVVPRAACHACVAACSMLVCRASSGVSSAVNVFTLASCMPMCRWAFGVRFGSCFGSGVFLMASS